ncbi:MAG: hypothetical protein ACK5LR_08810 [Mangrovibacterium sp.]
MKNIKYLFIAIVCSCFSLAASAQEISVKASVDSTNVLIGDQLHLKFELEHPKGIELMLPHFIDTVSGGIEVAELHALDTISKPKEDIVKFVQELTIQSFDTGLQTIPGQDFKFRIDTTEHVLTSNPVQFYVHAGFITDSITAPVSIKKPYKAPVNLAEASPYMLGAIILAALLFFIFYYINYLARKRAGKEDEGPKEPAHIIALRELERIKTSEDWKNEEHAKLYFSELSDTLRTYIQNRYGINAMEYTTVEIMHAFKLQKDLLEPKASEHLKDTLELADLVKFAKFKPLAEECERSLSLAFLFVKDTMVFESESKTEEAEKTENENEAQPNS